jgi:hypothetical protein
MPVGLLHDQDGVQRLGDIADILAAGLTRLNARKSSGDLRPDGESLLHCSVDRSGHEPVLEKGDRA